MRGYVLLPVVLAIAVIGAIAYLTSHQSALEVNQSASEFVATQVEYVVQAGLRHTEWLAGNNNCAGDFSLNNVALGSHSYSAQATTPATVTTMTSFTPDRDTSVRSNSADTNFGLDIGIDVGLGRRGLIHFDLSAIASGSRVVNARLILHTLTNNPQGTIGIHAVTTDWAETGATWNTIADSFDPQIMASIPPQASADTAVTVNITALAQSWINDSANNHGLMLIDNSNTLDSRYGSRNNSTSAEIPVLEVTVADAEVSPIAIDVTGTLDSGASRTLSRTAVTAYQPASLIVLQPGASAGMDSYLYEWKPTWNHGVSNDIWADERFADSTAHGLIRFDLDAVPDGAVVSSARLELYQTNTSVDGGPVGVYRVTGEWQEGTRSGGVGASNWSQRTELDNWSAVGGDFATRRYALRDVPAATGWSSWEITELVDGWVSGKFPNHGLALKAETFGAAAHFASSDASDPALHPRLSIRYSCACGEACIQPQGSGNVLLVVTNPALPLAGEAARIELIESWGYRVNLIDDDATQADFNSEIALNDVVYIAASASAAIGNKLTSANIGVVSEAGAMDAVLGFSTFQASPSPVGSRIDIVDNNHFITRFFAAGALPVYSADMGGHALGGALAAGLQTLASWNSSPGLAVLEAGAVLGGDVQGESAAARRVVLPFGQGDSFDWSRLNNNGRMIMQRAIAWVADDTIVAATLPVAHWKLDETSGATAVDSIGGHDGELRFGPVWTAGQVDGGLLFDGIDDELRVAHSDTLSFTQAFTFTAWINADSYSGFNAVLTKGQSGAHNYWFGTLGDEIILDLYIGGSWQSIQTSGAGLQAATWHHIAVAFDGGNDNVRLYLDGNELLNETTTLTPLVNSADILIGNSIFPGEVWPGVLDDVRIYEYAIDAAQISDLYSASIPPAPSVYTQTYQPWSPSTADTWEIADLALAGVPANAVVEVAVMNSSSTRENLAGIRVVGSPHDRRLLFHEAESGGSDIVVMHVQTDEFSRIETYAESVSDVSFVLLGYWTAGSFVEAMDFFGVSNNASWESVALSDYGVPPGVTVEIVASNESADNEFSAGLRSAGSISERRVTLHEAESGGVDAFTMWVKAGSDASATIEVYSESVGDVEFYLTGYWSPAPTEFVEGFAEIGASGASGQWSDHDLSALGVPADSVVNLVLENAQATAEAQLGGRQKGSGLNRLLVLQEAESGGGDFASMHVVSDTASTIQLFDDNTNFNHRFHVLGWWLGSP